MNVLMITPMVDEQDSLLGFITGWINSLARKVENLNVITLKYNMETELLDNVTVYDLGEGSKIIKYVYFSLIVLKLVNKKMVDAAFCHMYPVFAFMVYPWAKLFKVPIVQWYCHGHVDLKLKIMCHLVDKIVTASPESCRIKSDKVVVIGHGIDTDMFKPNEGRTIRLM